MKHQLVITATGEIKLPQPSTTGHCHYPCCCCSHYCYYHSSTSYSAIPQVRTALVWGRMKCMKCIGHHLAPIMGFPLLPPIIPISNTTPLVPSEAFTTKSYPHYHYYYLVVYSHKNTIRRLHSILSFAFTSRPALKMCQVSALLR